MFERYSEPARLALFQARLQAAEEASDHISTRHLVLGALKAGQIELNAETPFDKDVRMILVRAPRERHGEEVMIEDLLRTVLNAGPSAVADVLRRAGFASKL